MLKEVFNISGQTNICDWCLRETTARIVSSFHAPEWHLFMFKWQSPLVVGRWIYDGGRRKKSRRVTVVSRKSSSREGLLGEDKNQPHYSQVLLMSHFQVTSGAGFPVHDHNHCQTLSMCLIWSCNGWKQQRVIKLTDYKWIVERIESGYP